MTIAAAAAAAGNTLGQTQAAQQLVPGQQQQGSKPLSTYMQRKLKKEAADAAKLAAQQQSNALMYGQGGPMGLGGSMQGGAVGLPQFPSFAGLGRTMMPHTGGYPTGGMMNMPMGYPTQPSQMQGKGLPLDTTVTLFHSLLLHPFVTPV